MLQRVNFLINFNAKQNDVTAYEAIYGPREITTTYAMVYLQRVSTHCLASTFCLNSGRKIAFAQNDDYQLIIQILQLISLTNK